MPKGVSSKKLELLKEINVRNLIIETIEEDLRKFRLILTCKSLFNGNCYYDTIRVEYLQKTLKKHIERQNNLFEELCKLN